MKNGKTNWKITIWACYLTSIAQAAVINFAPILFIPLREMYGFSYAALGALVFVNFISQVISDMIFAGFSDKFGFRPLAVGAPLVAALGFVLFALAPVIFPNNVYVGLVIGTVVFSAAGGILDITASPIINAIPTEGGGQAKKRAMSLLHSFYAWGQVAVVVLTTVAIYFLGAEHWQLITVFWAALPTVACAMCVFCPLGSPVPEGMSRTRPGELLRNGAFILLMLTIFTGAATELCMSQWSSSFMERSLGLPKIWGDILGMAGFGAMLGVGRLCHGIFGNRFDLRKIMLACCGLGVVCYLVVALCPVNGVGLAACMLAGLAGSMLWPGTLSLAGERFPAGGAWMFAALACSGDVGGSLGAWVMGVIADTVCESESLGAFAQTLGLSAEQLGLRGAMLAGAVFPVVCGIALVSLERKKTKAIGEK